MKKFFKWFMFAFIGLIVLGAITSTGDEEKASPVKTETAAPAKKEKPKKEKPKKPANDPGISKAEFEKIKAGMTYEEAVKIIGGKGELMSESGEKGDQFYTVMYMFEGSSLGSNANMTFQGEPATLQNKAQFGLK